MRGTAAAGFSGMDECSSASAVIGGPQLERQLSRALQPFDHRQVKISGRELERLLVDNGYSPYRPIAKGRKNWERPFTDRARESKAALRDTKLRFLAERRQCSVEADGSSRFTGPPTPSVKHLLSATCERTLPGHQPAALPAGRSNAIFPAWLSCVSALYHRCWRNSSRSTNNATGN